MALASWLLLDSPYGAFADGAFRDHDKDRLDTRDGFRGFSRLGAGIPRVDAVRNRAIAQAAAEALTASEGFSLLLAAGFVIAGIFLPTAGNILGGREPLPLH